MESLVKTTSCPFPAFPVGACVVLWCDKKGLSVFIT